MLQTDTRPNYNPRFSCRQLLCCSDGTGRDANCTLEMAAPRVSDQNPSSLLVHSYTGYGINTQTGQSRRLLW